MGKKLSREKSYVTLLLNIGLADGKLDGFETLIAGQVFDRLRLKKSEMKEYLQTASERVELELPEKLEEKILLLLDAFVLATGTTGIDAAEQKTLDKLFKYFELEGVKDLIIKEIKARMEGMIEGDFRVKTAKNLAKMISGDTSQSSKSSESKQSAPKNKPDNVAKEKKPGSNEFVVNLPFEHKENILITVCTLVYFDDKFNEDEKRFVEDLGKYLGFSSKQVAQYLKDASKAGGHFDFYTPTDRKEIIAILTCLYLAMESDMEIAKNEYNFILFVANEMGVGEATVVSVMAAILDVRKAPGGPKKINEVIEGVVKKLAK